MSRMSMQGFWFQEIKISKSATKLHFFLLSQQVHDQKEDKKIEVAKRSAS